MLLITLKRCYTFIMASKKQARVAYESIVRYSRWHPFRTRGVNEISLGGVNLHEGQVVPDVEQDRCVIVGVLHAEQMERVSKAIGTHLLKHDLSGVPIRYEAVGTPAVLLSNLTQVNESQG